MMEVDDEEIEEASDYEYPDLEERPSYPWLGRSVSAGAPSSRELPGDLSEPFEDLEQDDDSDDPDYVNDEEAGGRNQSWGYQEPIRQNGHLSAISDMSRRSSDEGSDEDNAFFTLQTDVATFQEKLQQASRARGRRPVDEPGWRKGGKRGPRGPRKPVEPSLEIKVLLAQANEAFISQDYEQAEQIATQVIQMNAETYAAHALLSGVFIERGDIQMGIVAQMSAAHLRPQDVKMWQTCINLILEKGTDNRASYLNDAVYCYSRILGINPKDFESRYQRALLLRELGFKGRAAREFEQILEMLPEDTTVIRQLAEIYIDLQEIEKAKERYQKYIESAMEAGGFPGDRFSWSDVNIYIELFDYDGEYVEGIKELKSLSRWLLGREEESYWDAVEDDREWDAEDSRRLSIPEFQLGRFGTQTYGEGLPLELRVKLGVYRLKGDVGDLEEILAHFGWLEPEKTDSGAKLFDYPDLFQAAADALFPKGHHAQALRFYEPLEKVDGYVNNDVYSHMAACHQRLGAHEKAEKFYKIVLENDDANVEARVQLARVYEALGLSEQAFIYVNEVLSLERKASAARGARGRRTNAEPTTSTRGASSRPRSQAPRLSSRRKSVHMDRAQAEKLKEDAIQMHFLRAQALEEQMKQGNENVMDEWLEAATAMLDDFRSAKVFYPAERYIKFVGYSKDIRGRALNAPNEVIADIEATGERLQSNTETAEAAENVQPQEIPTSYRGIGFTEWLDVFLNYALCLARRGEIDAAYEVISAALEANVFHHSKDAMFLIHICWAACALAANDDEIICTAARWFTKEFQFTTDAYRLHAALNRLCQGPNSWYNAGPTQKYVLRQIKAMDYGLVKEEDRGKYFVEKASYTAKDENGHTVINDDMDVSLLLLYAEMLYKGASYAYALNYFFRAHAANPQNPMIKFYIGLSYLQHALKRQASNRHYFIMQGLSFLYEYYEIRQASADLDEQQEAEYNLARSLHMLGLTHLALPYYERVLEFSESIAQQPAGGAEGSSRPKTNSRGFAREAAYNLQNIYFMSGNTTMARLITEKYLVI